MNKDNGEIVIKESNDIKEEVKIPTLDTSEGNQLHEARDHATTDTSTTSTQQTNTTSELLSSADQTGRRLEDARTRRDEDHVDGSDGSTTSVLHTDDQGNTVKIEDSQNCTVNERDYFGTRADKSRHGGGGVRATGQNVFISNCGNNITTIHHDSASYRLERVNGVSRNVRINDKEEE